MKNYRLLTLLTISIISLIASCQKANKAKDISISFTNNDSFNVYNEWQLTYINNENYEDTGAASGTIDWSKPEPYLLSWEVEGQDKDAITSYVLTIKENAEIITNININKDIKEISLTNFKLQTPYNFILKAYNDNDVVKEISKDFIISQKGPRLIDVDGVENMRDLGGYGIKQGLIYRSGRLNEDDGSNKITHNGIKTMREQLHIKSEIDLRRKDETGDITSSPLGDDITYLHLPMVYGGNNIATFKGDYQGIEYDNPQRINDFFTYLSEENNYPIVFHCSIGKDRTGCLSYLLNGLLGVKEELLYRDYMFSNFANIGSLCRIKDITANNRYGQTINNQEGDSLKEKIRNFLLSDTIGLKEEIINKVSSILIDSNYGK